MRSAPLSILALVLCASSLATAQSLRVDAADQTLQVSLDGKPAGQLALPAKPRQLLVRGVQAYLAMGPAGLWVIDLSHPDAPVVLAKLAEGHDVTGVLPGTGNTVLAVEASWSVVPYDVTNPAAPAITSLQLPTSSPWVVGTEPTPPPVANPPAPVAPTPPPIPAVTTGSVTRVVLGSVVLDRGSDDGLKVGSRVEIFSQAPVERPNATTGDMERTPSNESMAVLSVKAVQPHGAVADLSRGDLVHVGDRFVLTTAPVTERLIWGRRQEFHHQATVILRPVLETGVLGVGSLSELRYSYHFDVPLTVEAMVSPLGFELRSGTGTRAFPTQLGAVAYYDTDYFAIGVGVGATFYSELPSALFPLSGPVTTSSAAARTAMYLNARLGSLDGLSLEVRNSIVVREAFFGEPATFHWGSTQVAGFIPLTRQLTLELQGGGGENGWGFGEVGIRTYFRGTGGAGTVIVPLCVGGGGFFTSGSGAGGPLVSIGVEVRL